VARNQICALIDGNTNNGGGVFQHKNHSKLKNQTNHPDFCRGRLVQTISEFLYLNKQSNHGSKKIHRKHRHGRRGHGLERDPGTGIAKAK
jgi:hypothetical protein